jgi:hypothetical protein
MRLLVPLVVTQELDRLAAYDGFRHHGACSRPYQILQGRLAHQRLVLAAKQPPREEIKSLLPPWSIFFPTLLAQLTGTRLSSLYSQFILTASCPAWSDLLSRLLHSLFPLPCPVSPPPPQRPPIYCDEMAATNIISKSERTGTTCLEMSA